MYKTVNFLFVLLLSVLLFTSCEKETILEVSQSSLTFIEQGGTQTISISTNKDWTISVSDGSGWCHISPISGNSDIKTISITTPANSTFDDRTATITIKAEKLSKVITITQPKNRAIKLTKDSYDVGSAGGNITVELNSNVDYEVTIPTENQTWITNITTKGLATSTLTFEIALNSTYDSRTGKIIIKDKTTSLADTVHVTQAQKNAIILSQKTINVADTLIVVSVELRSNTPYIVSIPSATQSWIKQLQTKALKTESLQFEIARNTSISQSRMAKIIIISYLTTLTDTLTIYQTKAPYVPTLTTYDPSDITAISAKSGGNITNDGGGEVLFRGVCWSKYENPLIAGAKTTNGKGSGTFSAELTELLPATKYYARSYAINRTGVGYGNSVTFTTLVTKPTVTTVAATQVTKNSAITGGNITSTGGSAITQRGVCWSTSENPTITGSKTSDGSSSGVFTSSIIGLMPVTKYFVRAYATNSVGTSYGEQVEFTTLRSEPTVETQSITISLKNSVVVNCRITNDGGAEVTERGVCWGLNDNPTIADNIKNYGTGIGSFTAQFSNLQLNSTYYVRAYAKNIVGVSYGATLTIKTYGEAISDVEGNTYSTIKIGTQTWMAENLKTTKYRNGNLIGTTTPAILEISAEITPKYQWAFDGNESNVATYGRLYTWYAAIDSRQICPTGWHVPNDFEWEQLINYLGGANDAGGKLKEIGTTNWKSPNTGATNSSGFTALPSGMRSSKSFFGLGEIGNLWSVSQGSGSFSKFINLDYYYSFALFSQIPSNYGHAIRCIKD